jgi:hypothetical protein
LNKSASLVSIIPNLLEKKGHVFDYHKLISNILEGTNVKHIVCYYDNSVNVTCENWHRCLDSNIINQGFFFAIKNFSPGAIFKDIKRLKQSIQTAIRQHAILKNNYVFIERFNPFELLSFYLAARDTNKNLNLIILYRNVGSKLSLRNIFYIFLNSFFSGKKNQIHIINTTDSELISSQFIGSRLKVSQVLPIPYNDIQLKKFIDLSSLKKIRILWPGQPRKAKGLNIIKKLLMVSHKKHARYELCVSEEMSDIAGQLNININFHKSYLSRKDYIKLLLSSNIILLPYDPSIYKTATSGIFVESIMAGALPIVRNGTWMEHELKKFGLDALAIDKDDFNFDKIDSMIKNKKITDNMMMMQKAYMQFHTKENFKKTFLSLM